MHLRAVKRTPAAPAADGGASTATEQVWPALTAMILKHGDRMGPEELSSAIWAFSIAKKDQDGALPKVG